MKSMAKTILRFRHVLKFQSVFNLGTKDIKMTQTQ